MNLFKSITAFTSFTALAGLVFLLESCSFSERAAQSLYDKARGKTIDLVIVPGVPLENGKWSRTMKGRIYWSKFLYDKGIVRNIMFSGSAVYSPYYEAEIMALYAEAIGIPREHIFTETRAEHSTENVYYSYKKAKKLNFSRIALASDPFQTKSLRRFTRKIVSPDVLLIPMVIDSMKVMEPMMSDPEIDVQRAFVENFIPITERENFRKRFRGTRGLNIDEKAYE